MYMKTLFWIVDDDNRMIDEMMIVRGLITTIIKVCIPTKFFFTI